jgi:signal transduction histidine kinase
VTRGPAETRAQVDLELEVAVRELKSLGSSLASSYRSLEERAEKVEQELARANRELAAKVAALDEVTADLEAVLAALPTGVLVRDAAGRIVRANAAAREVLGASEEELAGTGATWLDRAEPRGAPSGASGDEAGQWNEREYVRGDGKRLVIARRRSPVARTRATARGGAPGSVEILDDRTHFAELSERLHALDKLAALGNMAGGIAHELRNPMMAVHGFAALLEHRLPCGSEERRWAALIVEGAGEANTILTGMMSLATPDKLVLATVDPAELAAAAERLARRDLDGAARWTITRSVDAPPFAGDRIKLRQALRNLLANALQALPEGGTVALDLAREGGELVARVSDSGPGIPRELRGRVLEPFFTTRPEGTGLGLALVQRIAELHGGRVEISAQKSRLGGAEVSLRIPYRSPEAS